jgi:hypothetical protein
MATNNRLSIRITLGALLYAGLGTGLGGCFERITQRDGPDMAARIHEAPPIRIESSGDVHIIIMQAPNPGWSFSLQGEEQIPEGKRIFVTITKPDPTMLYPQMIVEKQLRTLVSTEVNLEIHARLLDVNETTKRRRYTPINTVDSFEG